MDQNRKKRIRTLANASLPPGVYLMYWDLKDDVGQNMPDGQSYSYTVAAENQMLAGDTFSIPHLKTDILRK